MKIYTGRNLFSILVIICAVTSSSSFAIPVVQVDSMAGSDASSGAPGSPKKSLTSAMSAVDSNGQILVLGGNLNESVTIAKSGVTLEADSGHSSPVLSAPDSVVNSALITVTANNVTIDGFTFHVNQPDAAVGINFTSGDNLTVKNSLFYTSGSGADASSYAAGIPTQSIGISAHNQGNSITVSDNYIGFNTSNPASIAPFDRALFFRSVHGSLTGNSICGINHDAAIQFVNGGPMIISSNNFLGWGNDNYKGAQLDLTEPENSVTISGNTFTPQPDDVPLNRNHVRSLMVKNNTSIPNANFQILNNTFNLRKVGILAANSIGETIHNNDFMIQAGASNVVGIQINNKVPTGGSPIPNTNSAIITGNTFGPGTGTGIALLNHNSIPAPGPGLFGSIVIGGAAADQNSFDAGLSNFISLDGLTGSSQASGLDGYAGFGNTTMAPFPVSLDVSQNSFGGIVGSAATTSESFNIENKILHRMDTDRSVQTGLATWKANELFVTDPVGPSPTDSSIQRGVESGAAGTTIHVQSGSYIELVAIDKANLNLLGETPKPSLRAPASGNGAAIITVDAAGVNIDNFDITVENPFAWSGIRAINNNFDQIQISNNTISADGSYSYTSGQYHYGIELPNFSSLSHHVNIKNNVINALAGATLFQRGIYLRSGNGVIGGATPADGNDIKAGIQDILAQFCGFGLTEFTHNTMRGAGLDLTEPESHGPVTISSNTFSAEEIYAQSLLVKHSYAGALVQVMGNTFTGHQYRGIVAAGSNNVKINNNQFDAAPTSSYPVTHIELNTQWPGSPGAPYNPNSYEVTDNSFKNTGSAQVDGILIANGYPGSQSPDFASLIIGAAGEENDFYGELNQFIVLSNIAGKEANANISIGNNRFDIGTGLTLPSALSFLQNFRLEDRIFHKVDAPATGFAHWIDEHIFVTLPEPGSTDSDVANGVAASGPNNFTVNVEPGLYNGATPIIDAKSSFTLIGSDPNNLPVLTSGLIFGNTGSTNLTLSQLILKGQAAGPTATIVKNDGLVTNFTLNNVSLDGENVDGRHGIVSGTFNGEIVFDRCQFADIMGWSAFDSKSGGSGSSITTATLTNTSVNNVHGHINFRQNASITPYPNVFIANNTITGGDTMTTGAAAAIKVFNGNNVSVIRNVFENIPAETVHVAGEEVDGCGFMPRNVAKLYVSGNLFKNNNVGMAVERNQPISVGAVVDNLFEGNGVGIYFPNNPTSIGNLLIGNNQFDGQTTFSIRNGSPLIINAQNNWFGDPAGPAQPENGASANVVIYPWNGEPGVPEDDFAAAIAGASSLTLNTLAGSPQSPAGADIVPAAGTFTGGETFTILESPVVPFQGFYGFEQPGGIPRSLFFNSDSDNGSFISTVKLGYTDFDISGYTETELYLATWDAMLLKWVPAVDPNASGSPQWQGASFPLPPTAANLGKYGVDTTNNIAWAVVDHASEYAVGSGSGSQIVPVALSGFSLE